MKIIAAVDKNFGLGYKDKLLFKIPEDMDNFKKLTTGNIVIMGVKTFNSMGARFLPNRINILVSSIGTDRIFPIIAGENWVCNYAHTDKITSMSMYEGREIYIIGGGKVYDFFIEKCDEIILTKYNKDYAPYIDTYFPIEKLNTFFKEDELLKHGEYEGLPYSITKWIKK